VKKMAQHKNSLVVIHQHPFIPQQYDFYQLFLNTMSLNQVRRGVKITNRGYQYSFTSDKLTMIHDTFTNSIAKLNLWCDAQYVINPSCMIDDRFLLMRRGDILNLIDYIQDKVEESLLLCDTDCSDFGEINSQLNNTRIQNQLRTDVVAISPNGKMFCLFDPITRTIYGGGLHPLKLLFRFKVPLSNDDDFVHMMPADNMTAFVVPGHGLQSYYLKPMDLRTYVCMHWSLSEAFKSTISAPASVVRVNDSVCYIPYGNDWEDSIIVDTFHQNVAPSRISIKKRMEKRRCLTKLESKDCNEEEEFLRPRKKLKSFQFGSDLPVTYRSIGLLHDGNNIFCIQEPIQGGNEEILRVVNVDDGSYCSLSTNSTVGSIGLSSTISSPKKIQSPNRKASATGKRKRSYVE
jgi:hypothetical protein